MEFTQGGVSSPAKSPFVRPILPNAVLMPSQRPVLYTNGQPHHINKPGRDNYNMEHNFAYWNPMSSFQSVNPMDISYHHHRRIDDLLQELSRLVLDPGLTHELLYMYRVQNQDLIVHLSIKEEINRKLQAENIYLRDQLNKQETLGSQDVNEPIAEKTQAAAAAPPQMPNLSAERSSNKSKKNDTSFIGVNYTEEQFTKAFIRPKPNK